MQTVMTSTSYHNLREMRSEVEHSDKEIMEVNGMQDELLREIDRAEIALVRCYWRAIEHVHASENAMYDWDLADRDFTAPFLLARGFVALELCRELAGGRSLSGMAAQCGDILEEVLCGERGENDAQVH